VALRTLLDAGRPPHVGVLLDNTAEMAMALSAAALGGHVVVGLNTTRRGESLLADIRTGDCQVVLTDATHADLLNGLDLGDVRVIRVDAPEWQQSVVEEGALAPVSKPPLRDESLFMLIFTSGTSGEPKAVRVTHEKVWFPGVVLADMFSITRDDVLYVSMPLFHSNAVMSGYGLALATGATLALAERFSASGFLDDVRHFGATYMNYVGKPLSYILATSEREDDADNPLRLAFGNEANEKDIAAFATRFGCEVRDGFGSTENAVIISRVEGTPTGSLGRPLEGVKVLNRETGEECPPATFGPEGEVTNLDECVGELVNTRGAGQFAGYYNHRRADAGRDVLVRRPRLSRRGRLRLLRRPHRRLAPGRRGEPRGRARRTHPVASPRDQPGRGVRRPGQPRGRPAGGGAGAAARRGPRPGLVRGVPVRTARPRPQAVAPVRAPRIGPPPDRHQQGAEAGAGRGGCRRRRSGVGAGRAGDVVLLNAREFGAVWR
jgi:fatty-acyl-CoA synthase